MSDAFDVVRTFEKALCEYTGAKYCVTTTSCTTAIMLALAYQLDGKAGAVGALLDGRRPTVVLPRYTYVGVPYAVREAGGQPVFKDYPWQGAYRLGPYPVWDSARRFRQGMYSWAASWAPHPRNEDAPGLKDEFVCVSFHWAKTLGLGQGGAILHNSYDADGWLRLARFDGRTEGVAPHLDSFPLRRAWHAYMSPSTAAEGLTRLPLVDPHAPDIPWYGYPDLAQLETFKEEA